MRDFIRDNLLELAGQLIREHGLTIVAIILALCILGMLIGSAKRLTWRVFAASLDGGEKVVNQLWARPRAVLLASVVATIFAAGFGLGRRTAPPEVVEKPVHVTVPDLAEIRRLEGEIDRLKSLLAATTGEKSETVNKAVEFERRLTSSQGEITTLNGRIAALNNEKAELEGKLAPFLQPDLEKLDKIEGVSARIAKLEAAEANQEKTLDSCIALFKGEQEKKQGAALWNGLYTYQQDMCINDHRNNLEAIREQLSGMRIKRARMESQRIAESIGLPIKEDKPDGR